MVLEQEPFIRYKLKKEEQTFTTRLTENDIQWFVPAKKLIKQPKNSTAMKQLAEIGATIVLHDQKIAKYLEIIMGNDRRNKRIGVSEWDYKKVLD